MNAEKDKLGQKIADSEKQLETLNSKNTTLTNQNLKLDQELNELKLKNTEQTQTINQLESSLKLSQQTEAERLITASDSKYMVRPCTCEGVINSLKKNYLELDTNYAALVQENKNLRAVFDKNIPGDREALKLANTGVENSSVSQLNAFQLLSGAQTANRQFSDLLKSRNCTDKETKAAYLANIEALNKTSNNIMLGFRHREECINDIMNIFANYSKKVHAILSSAYVAPQLLNNHQKFVEELQAKRGSSFINEEQRKVWKKQISDLD